MQARTGMPTVLRLLRMLRTPGVPRKPKLAHVQDQPRSIYCQPCFRGEGGRTSRAVVLQGASTELPHPSPTESLSAWANPPRPHSSAPLTSQHKPRGYEVLGTPEGYQPGCHHLQGQELHPHTVRSRTLLPRPTSLTSFSPC